MADQADLWWVSLSRPGSTLGGLVGGSAADKVCIPPKIVTRVMCVFLSFIAHQNGRRSVMVSQRTIVLAVWVGDFS